MGKFWAGLKKACAQASRAKAPLLLSDTKLIAGAEAAAVNALRCAADAGELSDSKDGLGCMYESAAALRAAA